MREILPAPVLDRLVPLFDRVWTSEGPVVGGYALAMGGTERRYEARLVRCHDDKVLSLVRDITDRTRVEQALLASEQRYALATAAGHAGVWDWNLETNEVYVDPVVKAILGFEDHELSSDAADWTRLVHPDDLPMISARARDHIGGEAPRYEAEHRIFHKDGSIRWLLARGSVVYDDGRPKRMVGTCTDITERKQADEALRQAQADLDRLSRLAALGEFGASIAHEVSQPLTTIMMNARTCVRELGKDTADPQELRASLLDIIEASKHADAVVRRHRELFRHHTIEKGPLSFDEVVRDVAMLAAARLSAHRVIFNVQVPNGLPLVLGDRVQLCEVLLNLVANGIEAMQSVPMNNRVLTVTSGVTPQHEILVSVSDVGVGLDGVDVDRMFAAAYTTKTKGTGLGLSISRTIIDRHGGRIWATRNDGPGATVSFTLPIDAASSAALPAATPAGRVVRSTAESRASRASLLASTATNHHAHVIIRNADKVVRRNHQLFGHHVIGKRPLSVDEVVHDVTRLAARRIAANNVVLNTRITSGLPLVVGDRIQLSQVVLNLISNGIEAMQSIAADERVLTVTSELTPQHEVLVAVSDVGVGLDGVDLDRMFTGPYATEPKSTGVGLSISRTIIVAHGGRIWATRNDGPGATFAFALPAQAPLPGPLPTA
jgi:PAS domain S-box-containing protein